MTITLMTPIKIENLATTVKMETIECSNMFQNIQKCLKTFQNCQRMLMYLEMF